MKVNQFVWDTYKTTSEGKKAIKIFESLDAELIRESYFSDSGKMDDDPTLILDAFEYIIPEVPDEMEAEDAELYFKNLIEKGVKLRCDDGDVDLIRANDFEEVLYRIPLISIWLYSIYPMFFKPYLYHRNFKQLVRIADIFGIYLPSVPIKKQKKERGEYYWEICQGLNKFQAENSFTDSELCAFLYDFAPKYLRSHTDQEIPELPEPTQIWIVGGNLGGEDINFLDQAKDGDSSDWQGNIDTKRGDIIIMYCLKPLSSIHSVWRAEADGYADPFFHFYSLINISNPIKIPNIHIRELKADKYFSQIGLVKGSMQGLNGRPVSSVDYGEYQRLIEDKGFDTSILPSLYQPEFKISEKLLTERDVEEVLLEPLFEKLGFAETDWTRQMAVRMGRGERNYPDYAFFVSGERGYEKCKMIIEAKYHIKSNKDLEETFRQAHSYAMRLESATIVLCDKNAIWVYNKYSSGYDRSKYFKKFWQELEDIDGFNTLKKLLIC